MARLAACSATLALLILAAPASAYTIDGDLSDWGVAPRQGGASDWIPDAGIRYVVEVAAGNRVDPGVGGHLFDAEALYAYRAEDALFLALVTGHPPDGASWGGRLYLPGDIGFRFGPSAEYGFGLRTRTTDRFVAGGLHEVTAADWESSGNFGGSTDPTRLTGIGKLIGVTDLFYGPQADFEQTGSHYILETVIPASWFGSLWSDPFEVHWTMTCGNDAVDLSVAPPVVPEPSTFILFGLGLVSAAVAARVRRSKSPPSWPPGR